MEYLKATIDFEGSNFSWSERSGIICNWL